MRSRARAGSIRGLCAALALLVAVAGTVVAASGVEPADVRRRVADAVDGIALAVPADGAGAPAAAVEATPVGPATTPPERTSGAPPATAEPAAWDPCRPITVRLNDALAPAGAGDALWAALGELAAATGLSFRDGGRTTAVPTSAWLRSGDGAGTLVVSWAPRATTDVVVPGSAATGGWYATDGQEISSGFVVVDATPGAPPLATALLGTLLLHELGHVVGLSHVDDPSQVMYPTVSPSSPDHYTPGDLAALAVRSFPCT